MRPNRVPTPATDPYGGLRRPSRAHATAWLSESRLVTTDLGFDLARVWSIVDEELALDEEVPLGKGCGPRHIARHPLGQLFIVTEYSIEIVILAPDASSRFGVVFRGPATLAPGAQGDAAAEIAINAAGNRAYVTVRGSNRLSTIQIASGGRTFVAIDDASSGGGWPRHHLLYGDRLFVANEHSSTVTAFRLGPTTSTPILDGAPICTPSPTCLLPPSIFTGH